MVKISKLLKSERGSALVIVLALVVIVSITATALIMININTSEGSLTSQREIKALERARGGVEHALYEIDKMVRNSGEIEGDTWGGYNDLYEVTVTVAGEDFEIVSKSHYPVGFGEKFVQYVVNGSIGSGTGGNGSGGNGSGGSLSDYTSQFFNYAITTEKKGNSSTLAVHHRGGINEVSGIVRAHNVQFKNNSGNLVNPGWDMQAPVSKNVFEGIYNSLVSQANTKFPLPNNFPGTNATYQNATLNGRQDFGTLTIEQGATLSNDSTVTINGDLYANKIKLDGSSLVKGRKVTLIVNGDVYANSIELDGRLMTLKVNGSVRSKKIDCKVLEAAVPTHNTIDIRDDLILLGSGNSSKLDLTRYGTPSTSKNVGEFILKVGGLFLIDAADIVIDRKMTFNAGYVVAGHKFEVDVSPDPTDKFSVGGLAIVTGKINGFSNLIISGEGASAGWVGDTFYINSWDTSK